jgi:hypothetical protein
MDNEQLFYFRPVGKTAVGLYFCSLRGVGNGGVFIACVAEAIMILP